MKNKLVLILFSMILLRSGILNCQIRTETFIKQYDENRIKRQKTSLKILGTWSVINITSGLALRTRSEGDSYYFHEMNAGWNTINLAIAASGLLSLKKQTTSSNPFEMLESSLQYEKSLLFNAGLDLAYITAGAFLIERGINEKELIRRQRFRGYGRSIILQGMFLLLFDSVLYFNESRFSSALREGMQSIYLMPGGLGIGLSL
jgi:hypothetical protein